MSGFGERLDFVGDLMNVGFEGEPEDDAEDERGEEQGAGEEKVNIIGEDGSELAVANCVCEVGDKADRCSPVKV